MAVSRLHESATGKTLAVDANDATRKAGVDLELWVPGPKSRLFDLFRDMPEEVDFYYVEKIYERFIADLDAGRRLRIDGASFTSMLMAAAVRCPDRRLPKQPPVDMAGKALKALVDGLKMAIEKKGLNSQDFTWHDIGERVESAVWWDQGPMGEPVITVYRMQHSVEVAAKDQTLSAESGFHIRQSASTIASGGVAQCDHFVVGRKGNPPEAMTGLHQPNGKAETSFENLDIPDPRYRDGLRSLAAGTRPIGLRELGRALGSLIDDDNVFDNLIPFFKAYWNDLDSKVRALELLFESCQARARGLPPPSPTLVSLGDEAKTRQVLAKLIQQPRPISAIAMRQAILDGTNQGDPRAANAVYDLYRSFFREHGKDLDTNACAAFFVYERLVRDARCKGLLGIQGNLAREIAAADYQSTYGAQLIERLKGHDDPGRAIAHALAASLEAPDAELSKVAADFTAYAGANPNVLGSAGLSLTALFARAVNAQGEDAPLKPDVLSLPLDRDKLRKALLGETVYDPCLLDELPAPRPKSMSRVYGLKRVAADLMVNGVAAVDVQQRLLFGNCPFCASCASLANCRPELLAKMITDNEDGTYTVRFRVPAPDAPGFCELPVLVDGRLFVTASGDTVFGHLSPAWGETTKSSMWFAIVEKAFAAMSGGYAAIEGGTSWFVLSLLTGTPCDVVKFDGRDDVIERLRRVVDARQPCVVSQSDPQHPMPAGIEVEHAYSLLGYTEQDGKLYFILRNPWGFGEPAGDGINDGVFWMSANDLATVFEEAYFAQVPTSDHQ